MDIDEAVQFLQKNQPLPNDSEVGDRITIFDEVRKFLRFSPDAGGLALLLGAFGEGDGFGVYQLVSHTALAYPPKVVIPIIEAHLSSPFRGVRYWNAEIAISFPSEALIDSLKKLLQEDFDMRYTAITALGQIKSNRSREVLINQKNVEVDVEILELIENELAT